jgi:hypothetical protein
MNANDVAFLVACGSALLDSDRQDLYTFCPHNYRNNSTADAPVD